MITHCYQRTIDRFLIFYSVRDFIVFFSILSVAARRRRIRIYKLCLMPDHYHIALSAGSAKDLILFIQELTSRFARAQNIELNRKGSLFERPFGHATKKLEKSARSTLIYIDNNPVERHLCKHAEEYRWNFLAYARSKHPFSPKMVRSKESKTLRQMLSGIDNLSASGKPVTYDFLKFYFSKLSREEKLQAVDYIISQYNVIDYEAAVRFFGTYENMLTAEHATTGSEYDLKEVFTGRSDACYARLTRMILRETGVADIHEILAWPQKKKSELYARLLGRTDATREQLFAYLRIGRL